MLTVELKYMF